VDEYGQTYMAQRISMISVVGGLLFSQVLTLYITPVIYIYLDNFNRRVKNWFRRKKAPLGETILRPQPEWTGPQEVPRPKIIKN
jgi:hypothetical protein